MKKEIIVVPKNQSVKMILRNDPAKQRKKLGKVKDLWIEHEANRDDRLYQEWVDREAIEKAMEKANNKSEERGNNE